MLFSAKTDSFNKKGEELLESAGIQVIQQGFFANRLGTLGRVQENCFGDDFKEIVMAAILSCLCFPIKELILAPLPRQFVEARFADSDRVPDLHFRDGRHVLAARAAENLAASPAVVAAFVDRKLDGTARARLGALVLHPVVHHSWNTYILKI